MTERTRLLKLKCIRSQVFDIYGEVVLRVPVDVTEQEIRELGGERELSCRADDPLCIDIPAITDVSEENIEPHGIVIRSDDGLQIKWPQ